ncbi:hypothetical protein [Ferrovibrio sp.]|uniref:hypothetical protein n=1 Tax=Ferrovibrio sp. TaxID=1917215 RepID=UPI003D2DAFE5
MKTVTIDIAAPDDMRRQIAERIAAAAKGRKLPSRISFASRELLWQVLAAGLLWKREDGKIEFPFDTIHVDFMVKAA